MITKPGYTKLPNEFVDSYIRQLSPYATVLYVVLDRLTVGWGEGSKPISLSILKTMTGFSVPTILKARKELLNSDLIQISAQQSEESGSKPTVYTILLSDEFLSNSPNDRPNDSPDDSPDDSPEQEKQPQPHVTYKRREYPPLNTLNRGGINSVNTNKEIISYKELERPPSSPPRGEESAGRDKQEKMSGKKTNPYVETAKRVIDYLNQEADKKFRYTDANLRHIIARLKEGFTEEDMRLVIDYKVYQWLIKDPRMREYLRPQTLFAGKFESYRNAIKD